MSGVRLTIPRAEVRGTLVLGPVPGTPEYEEEQRCKAAGIPYDYSACRAIPFAMTVPAPSPEPEPDPPPSGG